MSTPITIHSASTDSETAAADLLAALGDEDLGAILFFGAITHDLAHIGDRLAEAFPNAEVVGCSTAGEFDNHRSTTEGISAFALPSDMVSAAKGALIELDGDIDQNTRAAAGYISDELGVDLRQVDHTEYIGVVLIDGMSGKEEVVNRALGNIAPTLNFVGGSTGDNLAFEKTHVYANGELSEHGAAVLLMQLDVPFTIVKSCSFEPTETTFEITRADEEQRIVWEFNGKPAVEAYAEAVGVEPSQVDNAVFMSSPVGLMLEGEPWIRSPQQQVDNGGIKFYCGIKEGMVVSLMESTDLIGETRAALQRGGAELDGAPSAALVFNCILRRLELDETGTMDEFLGTFEVPSAGFHTYGESWMGHINQTLTAIVFGQ